ncbi:SDR family oxidoreductase [Anaeromyxobacter sp. Fw109-5]|uniref:SDR family NAD(P)-dependent oxidoreductase n=1 Tax=Anaeromyxobacter sp. (strain Fw109-5) TaxID=404589 RepID=UPI0000ED6E9B|nr:SDR family NAD(P)-dependent oxidoreductase [Anaeromyxobacter sp. Fw109-5]ABS28152.1 short-chain dehydrogenase/reductase SDR [Anaeromyxobacter sp. Fw109-5]
MPPTTTRPTLAVVTGASAGIGAMLAREISRRGRPVLAIARRVERLQSLAAEARALGHAEIIPLAVDLTHEDAPGKVAAAAREHGGAAWLVNNAGFGAYGQFERLEPARVREMIRLNCEALVLLSHALLPDLRAAGDGVLLNVASAAAFQATPYMSLYGATKAFVLSFSEGLSEEQRAAGVYVGAYCPGPVATEFGEVAGAAGRFERVPAVLSAEDAAREALAQIDRRAVVHVPTVVYRLTATAVRFMPRSVVRRIAAFAHREEK